MQIYAQMRSKRRFRQFSILEKHLAKRSGQKFMQTGAGKLGKTPTQTEVWRSFVLSLRLVAHLIFALLADPGQM